MKRTALLIAGVAGAVILLKFILEDALGIFPEPVIRGWVENAGTAGAVTIVGLLAVDIFLPVPSSLVMILSGAAFGVFWGSLLAFAGSMGGEWLGFELARRYGQRFSRAVVGEAEVARFESVFARHGAAAVAVSRALPVLMETMSVVAGLSTMARRTFLLSSALGTVPIVVVYAYAGMRARETGSLVPAVIILLAVAGAGWIWYRARIAPSESQAGDASRRLRL